MKVELLASTPLIVAVEAVRICYDSKGDTQNNGLFGLGPKDEALLTRVVESGHESTLEHLVYTFRIEGISRGCLQELARHRIASYSVQSSRYTLKKLLGYNNPGDLLVDSGSNEIDALNLSQLHKMMSLYTYRDINNDTLKYMIPEALKTKLIMTINARSLRNFFMLRTSNRAHKEIQKLAYTIFWILPVDHRFLFRDMVAQYAKPIE